jgi:hypothetical protein
VVRLKDLQEVGHNFLWGLSAIGDISVLPAVEGISQSLVRDPASVLSVKFLEGLFNNLLSLGAKVAED